MTPPLGLDPVADLRLLLAYPFMVEALRAGIVVGVVAGALGYLMVLRREAFAGHTLALVAFPGAAGATWLGVSALAGSAVACAGAALVIAAVPPVSTWRAGGGASGQRAAVVGVVQAAALAVGLLFVSLYGGFLNGLDALLFGSIVGISSGQVLALATGGTVLLATLAALGRPLLLASVDREGAAARGVRVRALDTAFLVLLGLGAAAATQVTGALLVFAVLVAPAAAAQRLTARPARALALAMALAVGISVSGETAAFFSDAPVGFWVTTAGLLAYLVAAAVGRLRAGR